MRGRYLLQSSRLLWIVVILLGFVALSWKTLISSFAGNVGLLLLARSLSSSVPLGLESQVSDAMGREQARQWLHMATQLNGANSGAWRGQGFGLAAEGQEQEALAAWHAAGITGQEFIRRGETARLAGNYLEALVWYERAEKLDPSLPSSVLYYRFLAQRALGHADSAFDSLRRAITTDQGWIDLEMRFRAWYSWGVRLFDQQRNREAEQALQTAISVFPTGPLPRPVLSEAYRFLGLAQWAQGKLDPAANSLKIAVQTDNQNVWAHIHYGKVLYLQDPSHSVETENEFAIALGLSPNSADAWKSLIQFWHLMKKTREAEMLCSQAQATAVASMLREECAPR
jgi:tetratricopeptide (TPR) repeat protein